MTLQPIPKRLFEQARIRPAAPAYYEKRGAAWAPTDWRTFSSQVRTAARALIALGFKPGDTTTILGFNKPEWVVLDVATMAAGGAPAGIYTTCSPNEVQYIIEHAEARFVLVEDAGQWAKVQAELDNLPKLEHVITMKGCAPIDHPKVMTWEAFLATAEGVDDAEVDRRVEGLDPDAMATLIYTSGTTGPPKAVMLTTHNLAWTADTAVDLVGLGPADSSVSYLPLSHIAEQMFTIHGPITGGSAVYYAESIEKLPDNLKEVQPTVLFGVPRIWEKFHTGINAKLGEAKGAKKALVDWAMGVGAKVTAKKNAGQPVAGLLGVQYAVATKLIFSKLKPAIGLGNARVCVSGAAPIAREVLEFFGGLDIIVLEVYGQSEDCGPTTFNRPGKTRYGTVGPAVPGVEVVIADDGEVLVRGPNVFKGYYKDPEATAETLDPDGWLHSGDLGAFDGEFLSITGRKKDIIITAGGKNIAPKNIEAALKNHPLVGEAVVIGDRRKFLSALVCLDPDAAAAWASSKGLDPATLHDSAELKAELDGAVEGVNALFARVEHIRKYTVLPRPLSVEEGELTPTLKVKRRIVNDHFSSEIEAMYAG